MKIAVANMPAEFDRYSTPMDLVTASRDSPLKGYPLPEDRWHIPAGDWGAMAETGVIVVPHGRWSVLNHPSREEDAKQGIELDPANPSEVSPAQKTAWRKEYALVTDQGLPIHPKAKLGVTTNVWINDATRRPMTKRLHRLGMATGIGRERRYGALNTGALLLARLDQNGGIEYPVVTECRNNRLRRSFPGGYVEPGESIADGCVRESNEEVHLVDACSELGIAWSEIEALPHILWKLSSSVTGPCTINAWLAEHFLAIDATGMPDIQHVHLRSGEPDKIESVEWHAARELLTDKALLGAHRRALKAHLGIIALR